MITQKEKTALSVGADRQSGASQDANAYVTDNSIANKNVKLKKKFLTVDGETLMSQPLKPVEFVVSSLLPKGLHILAGSPKIGKSWLVLWLCLQIAKGEKVWNMETTQGTTLYLCLEDSKSRIQGRLFDITEDAPPNIHFATFAENIGNGIEEQIKNFVSEHSDTKLIVIDTLQKIRSAIGDNAYANDYNEIGILKSLADRLNIAILLIHHLRKAKDGDPMNDGKSQIEIWLRYNRYHRSCRFKLYSCEKQRRKASKTNM